NTGILNNISQSYARVYEFTTTSKPSTAQGAAGSYIWLPPSDCAFLEILLVGGGGGGSSGARQALGVQRLGGGSGAAGAITWLICSRQFFTTSLSIVVGAGGAGGASVTTDSTSNTSGTAGTASTISMSGVQILAGSAGGGGQGSSGGATPGQGTAYGAGASASTTAYSASIATTNVPIAGAGGSASAANVYTNGQTLSPHGGPFFYDRRYQGVAGVATSFSGGGNCAANVAGGDGANGLFYGMGGSGGGASNNGYASGKGGNGADGYIRIVCF
ncbi:MAG: hypothetical protein EBV03_12240, partial [Proteobacteria bacterium]|nr:hypothetical protein [Pseudomonadota bacterium]